MRIDKMSMKLKDKQKKRMELITKKTMELKIK